MERNLNHDEFDQFLKENADGLRMRPTEMVWKNISRELDYKKRRFGTLFALTLLFLSGTYITWEIATTNQHRQITQQNQFTPVPQSYSGNVAYTPKATNSNSKSNISRQAQKTLIAASTTKTVLAVAKKGSPLPTTQPFADKVSAIEEVAFDDVTTSISNAPERIAIATMPPAKAAAPPPVEDLAPKQSITAADVDLNRTITARRNARKLNWQVFVTPTISYRVLSDNKSYVRPILTTGIPATFSALYGINEAVIHKPDLGIEFGVMGRYAVSKNLKLRTGFQFNVSRYDIRAFSFVPEVATIALNNGPRVDSVRAISNYRNFSGGGGSNWLQNFYFQASIPVGLELKIASNKNTHWGVASSIQPTYVIGNRSYMITADYKNYARVPWLSRRWNMNTSLETFVSINSGKTQWQIGPQVRYQVLSSFIKEYPVKENLFDFGMKVGVTLK